MVCSILIVDYQKYRFYSQHFIEVRITVDYLIFQRWIEQTIIRKWVVFLEQLVQNVHQLIVNQKKSILLNQNKNKQN